MAQAIRKSSAQVERIHRLRANAAERRHAAGEYVGGFALAVLFIIVAIFAVAVFSGSEEETAPSSGAVAAPSAVESIGSYSERLRAATN